MLPRISTISPKGGERSKAVDAQAVRRQTTVTRAPRSRARLQHEPTRRRLVAKPRTPHLIPQAAQLFKIETANVRGRGVRPLVLSLGGYKGGYSLSRKRVSPFDALPARPQGIPSHPTVRQYEPPPCMAGTPTRQGSRNTAPSRRRSCRRPRSRRPGRLPFHPR